MDLEIDWREIMKDLGPALYRYFLASFEPLVADEFVQETIVRLLDRVRDGRFDPQKGNLRMYAYGIANFVRLEGLRLRSHEELDGEHPSTEAPILNDQIHQERIRQRLRQAISRLTESQQQVLSLYIDSELGLNEIGAILGMPGATVRSHLHRAKEALKIDLENDGEVRNG